MASIKFIGSSNAIKKVDSKTATDKSETNSLCDGRSKSNSVNVNTVNKWIATTELMDLPEDVKTDVIHW